MESTTKNTKPRAQIEAMTLRAFGVGLANHETAVSELKDGWFNAAYNIELSDGREVILKIAPAQHTAVLTYEKNIMATEVTTMRLVQRNPAIPVPTVHFYDDGHSLCDADYFFMEKIAGDNLEHLQSQLQAEDQASIDAQIGNIIREINSFSGTHFGYDGHPDLQAATWKEAFVKIVNSVLEDGARKNVVYTHDPKGIWAAILRHAPALEEVSTSCLVHWDAWNPNFFVKDKRVVGIIDFERALWAEPLMEAQFRMRSFGADVTEAMRGYGKTTFTFTEEQRCQLYSLHLALVMRTECAYRNYDNDDVLNASKHLLGTTMAWLQTH